MVVMKIWYIPVFFILMNCSTSINESVKNDNKELSYLALGDSYTIGESVEERERFPIQLAHILNNKSVKTKEPVIIAKTGWTTNELLLAIDEAGVSEEFDIVTLLIGVNNQYRGYPLNQYKEEFKVLLDKAVKFAGGKNDHVFVISIPDYGVTPFSTEKGHDAQKIALELLTYNNIAREITRANGCTFINITGDSKSAKEDLSLIAADGLHPSGKMYGEWADKILVQVLSKFE